MYRDNHLILIKNEFVLITLYWEIKKKSENSYQTKLFFYLYLLIDITYNL